MSALDLTAKSFSIGNARELVLYAKMAYDEPPTVEDKPTDTQVLIRDLGDCVVVAPRGTANIRDFVTDIKCWRSYTTLGEVHSGFWRAWNGISAKLYAEVRQYGFKPVVLCGHSLGGALAMLAARALRQNMVNVHSVYNFGAPRVGNAKYQRNYNTLPVPGSPFDTLGDATFTIINDCDIVPRLPGYVSGFRRPGRDEFISFTGGISEDPSVPFRLFSDLESIAAAYLARRSPAALEELITDHHVDNYIADLNKVAPQAGETPALPA